MNIIQMLGKKVVYITCVSIIFSCSKKEANANETIKEKSTLTSFFDFPNEVYTQKIYKGKITFYNSTFDSIVEPRKDTVKFRYIIYKPFETAKRDEYFAPIFKDSVLLENNVIDIELKFDKPGVYNIGGIARDELMIGYYSGNHRDSVRFIEHELLMIKKIIVKDSI